MRKIYYESEFVRISIDEAEHLGIAEWNGFLSSTNFRDSALRCMDAIERFNLKFWLGDNRKMKAIRQADQQWMLEEFVPRLLASPLRRMATLVSEDIFNKMAVEQMIKRASPMENITLCDFDKEEAAMVWLKMPLPDKVVQQV